MAVNTGDKVQCTITQTGQWGAYAKTTTGEEVFINFGELTWERTQTAEHVVSVGDVVEVLICGEPGENRPTFLGSIKRAVTNGPWSDLQMDVGTIHEGVVVRCGVDVVFIKLTNGVLIGVQSCDPARHSLGDVVQVKLEDVNSVALTVKATFVHQSTK